MKVLENEELKKYTTIRLGGAAKTFYIPESEEEFCRIMEENKGRNYRVLSGGSNVIINENKEIDTVISMRECCKEIEETDPGIFKVGASVRLQKLIRTVNEKGYGGIEYLFSVPGLAGASVAMNAGRGRKYAQSISDYVVSVRVWENGEIRELSKEECGFSYRRSNLQGKDRYILEIIFSFERITPEEGKRRCAERIEHTKSNQEADLPNAGSVFKVHNKYIMRCLKITHPGFQDGMAYSAKTPNWIVNRGNGTYEQYMSLVRKAIKWHKVFRQKIELEVKVWD